MTKDLSIEVVNAILCDDTRVEDNGKAILIGVYTGDILVSELPASLTLAVWLNIKLSGTGNAKFTIEIVDANGKATAGIQGGLEKTVELDDYSALATPGLPVLVGTEGTVTVRLKVDDNDWVNIIEKRVRQK